MTQFEAVRDALLAADRRLCAPGGRFETVEAVVLGERMPVFRKRPASVREFVAASTRFGDRDCFVFGDGTRVPFSEFPRQVASTAAYLRDVHGVRKGDRVAICAPNDHGWLLVLWASLSMGAVAVGMNGWWSELEMANAVELSEPRVVFADAKRAARMPCSSVDLGGAVATMLAHAPDAPLPDTSIAEDDPAMLIFTSGTTGRPKAASLSHRSLVAYVMLFEYLSARGALLRGIDPPADTPPPTRLAVFPLFHVSGIGTTLAAVLGGGTTVWPLGRFDAGEVIELTIRERIGMWGGTATHILRLLEHPDIGRIDPSVLAAVGIGGSATTPLLIRRTEARFPHLAGTFSSGYGSTESGGLVSWTPNSMLTVAPDCVGPPLPTVSVRITDFDGRELPAGEEGDIWVRSPLVMRNYWNNARADADVLTPDRWYRTGDFGRLEHGVLFLASRRRDLIIRGGENVYPFEIENRLEEHPDVVEAAVIGVDDDLLGQRVKAIVVVADGSTLDTDSIRGFCAATLASYKVPEFIELRTEALPRNPTGKVMKQVLAHGDAGTFSDDPV